VGYDVGSERPLRHPDRCVGCAIELADDGAHRLTRKHRLRRGQHAATITVRQVRRDGNRTTVSFEVHDGESSVQKAEYSLDGDRWITVYPRDGIADSQTEQFELTLDGETGSRAIIVRATDALNNVANADVAVPSGRR